MSAVNEPAPGAESDEAGRVFYLYGAVMLAVQSFERNLATLALILNRSHRMRQLRTREEIARALQRTMNRSLDAYQRSSAKALRNKLPDDFDVELLLEIEGMLEWRDRLAHRYLLETLVDVHAAHEFQPGTAEELMKLGAGFLTLAEKLRERLVVAVAELPSGRRGGVDEMIRGWAQAIMAGEPWESDV